MRYFEPRRSYNWLVGFLLTSQIFAVFLALFVSSAVVFLVWFSSVLLALIIRAEIRCPRCGKEVGLKGNEPYVISIHSAFRWRFCAPQKCEKCGFDFLESRG
jgi:predicted RNA-binding Zn-ribbon protein involved in translation (DUF1610 family)